MLRKPVIALLIFISISIMAFNGLSVSKNYEYSGRFPRNYLIQDMEPAIDEQWSLDAVADEEGTLYSVWADDRTGVSNIFFSSSDDGKVWGDGLQNNNDIIVNDDAGEGNSHDQPSIAISDSGNLFCAWLDSRAGGMEIRISTSVSSGNSWRDSWAPIEHGGSPSDPSLSWTGGVLGLAWVEETENKGKDILFSRSADGGRNFSDPIRINDDTGVQDQVNPRMDSSMMGYFAIVWEDYRNGNSTLGNNPDIYMSYSSDSGSSFSENIQASPDPGKKRQQNADLSFSDSGDLLMAWEEYTSSGWRIMYSAGWTSSASWDMEIRNSYLAIQGSVDRLDQTIPRLAYVGNSFALAWSELNSRNFNNIRCAYLSRVGELFDQDHIVDDSIDWGNMTKEVDTYYAEMERDTSDLVGLEGMAQVFWIDHRTDPQPTDGLPQDGDPYTSRSNSTVDMPRDPKPVRLSVDSYTWGSVTLKWEVNPDIEFKSYYLTHGKGTAPLPDPYLPEVKLDQRAQTRYTFEDLKPSTRYQFRLMVRDRDNRLAYSNPINVTTENNSPPTFIFLEPDGISDNADDSFTIRWRVSDPEDDVNFSLYYDQDRNPNDQVKILSGNTDEEGNFGEYSWNTSDLDYGGYTINATAYDGVNDPVVTYSPALIVDHPRPVINFTNVLTARVEGGIDSAHADGPVIVTMSSEPDPKSLDSESIYLLDEDQMKIEGAHTVEEGNKIIWTPERDLNYDSFYTLVMRPTIRDIHGDYLDGGNVGSPSTYRFRFKTMDNIGAPDIIDWSPHGEGADPWTSLYIEFDIPVNPNSLSPDSISLESTDGSEIPLDIRMGESTRRIVKAEVLRPLETNTLHLASVSPLIESEKGSRLGSGFNWTFVTGDGDQTQDRDGDGTPDDFDWFPNDPDESMDSDRDGIGDSTDKDDDNDGLPDDWEIEHGLDPQDPTDAENDPDGDGKTNKEEYISGTDPKSKEEDGPNWLLVLLIVLVLASVLVALVAVISYARKSRLETRKEMDSFFREE